MAKPATAVKDRMRDDFSVSRRRAFSDLLDVHYYDPRGWYFHTVDGRFARVWKLDMFAADVLSPVAKLYTSNGLAQTINRFPELSCGQIIRTTHNHIGGMLDTYMSDCDASGFSRDVVQAVAERQVEGAIHGFFEGLGSKELGEAAEDFLSSEGDIDPTRRQALMANIERTVATGRFAYITDLYLVFMYTPYWLTKLYTVDSALKRVGGVFGMYDLKGETKRVYEKERSKFLTYCSTIENTAANFNFAPAKLSGQALVNLLYRELNPVRSRTIAPPEYCQDFTVREILDIGRQPNVADVARHSTFSELDISASGWKIDGVHYKSVSAKSLPKVITPGAIYDAICKIEGENWVVINFNVEKQSKVRNMLRIRRTALQSNPLAHIPFFKGDEVMKREKQNHIDYAINATNVENKERELVVNCSVHVVLKGENEAVLKDSAERLRDGLWGAGLVENNIGGALIHQCLPLNYRPKVQELLGRENRCMASNAADLAPVFVAFDGVASPGMLVNNEQGMPIFIDIFSTIAGHFLVQGSTGSGKSFLFNNLIMQLQKYKAKIFLVDKGGSYQSQCEAKGGSYVDLALSEVDGVKPICLNTFYLKPGKPLTEDTLEFMRDVIVCMMRAGAKNDEVSKEDLNTILKAIEKVFRTKHDAVDAFVAANPDAPADDPRADKEVVLSDIYHCLVSDPEFADFNGPRIALRFAEFTKGQIYGRMFDGKLAMNWDSDFIVFETQRVANSVAMPVIMMALFYQVDNYCKFELPDTMRKVFAIDEAWAVLADPVAATRIAGFYREMRKYKTAVGLISQTITDFASLVSADGSGGDGILPNTKHYFLLPSSAIDVTEGKKLLNLTDEEVAAWGSASSLPPFYSECFYRMMADNNQPHSGKFRLVSNPLALWTATTDPDDKAMRRVVFRKHIEIIPGGLDPETRRQAEMEARASGLRELAKLYPRGYRYFKKQQQKAA